MCTMVRGPRARGRRPLEALSATGACHMRRATQRSARAVASSCGRRRTGEPRRDVRHAARHDPLLILPPFGRGRRCAVASSQPYVQHREQRGEAVAKWQPPPHVERRRRGARRGRARGVIRRRRCRARNASSATAVARPAGSAVPTLPSLTAKRRERGPRRDRRHGRGRGGGFTTP